jgi:acetyl-CoA C-acetyltransferase
MKPVAILGAAQTRHAASRDDVNYTELAFEVVSELLEKTGFSHDRIDTVISASSDFWDGRTISDIAIQDPAGAAFKSASKVSMDGAFALVYAMARIACGKYGTCLVVAHGKASEGEPRAIANAAFDPIFQRPTGVDDHAALGLQARRYLDKRGAAPEVLARAASGSAAAASRNPFAHARDVGRELVADPLHENEIAPDSDGACALLLAAADLVEGEAVWLDGFGFATDAHGLGDRDLGVPGVLPQVAAEAYRRAGIGPDAPDVVEVHDASSAQTLLWKEGLGVGDVDFNPSGGAMGAQPGFATGLVRVAEVFERVKKVGVAHGMTGFVGQAHCVWVLGRR